MKQVNWNYSTSSISLHCRKIIIRRVYLKELDLYSYYNYLIMKRILQILGGVLLVYSAAGMLLHFLANFEGFGHECEMLLISFDENHLMVFSLTAAISATLFFTARVLTDSGIRKSA